MGQANHLLITGLVGLHTLESSAVTSAPASLHAAWNPRSKNDSVARSRVFMMHSFLGWAVDSLDMYASLLYRKPNYIQDASACSMLDGAGRSVWKKVHRLSEHYGLSRETLALVDVMIAWRNNVFHELADNVICDDCAAALKTHSAQIQQDYRGLDPSDLPDKAAAGSVLSFKETASLINAAHSFVQEVDAAVISRLDWNRLCVDLVAGKLSDDTRFRAKYFSLAVGQRERLVGNLLATEHGISGVDPVVLACCADIPSPRRC